MYDETIIEFRKAIEINPYDGSSHNNLAVCHYSKEEYSLAINHCDKAVELGYRVNPELLKDLEPHREK